MAVVNWIGRSGNRYAYNIHPVGGDHKKVPGNYIFAKLVDNLWHAVYIGETGDMSVRFDNHHKARCIQARGATHLHSHVGSPTDEIRRAEEKDLVDNYAPPCNG